VDDHSYLAHVSIKNTPIDSYKIARDAILVPAVSRLESYCFQGVNWEITNTDDVVIENNEIIGIKILNKLAAIDEAEGYLGLAPYEGLTSHGEALTGTITVKVGDYKINEYALYNKYNKVFPNLNIRYESNNLQSASRIDFYNSEVVMGEPYYSVLTDGTATLEYLISKDGPTGIALTTPIKVSDNDEDFTFNGQWTVAETEAGSIFTKGIKIAQADFGNYKPNKNTAFVANYNSSPREYKVTLYDDDGTTILLETTLNWNDDIGKKLNNQYSQLTFNYKEYDKKDLYPHNRYVFKGWQSSYDFNNKA
jgi:hypothetical protein